MKFNLKVFNFNSTHIAKTFAKCSILVLYFKSVIFGKNKIGAPKLLNNFYNSNIEHFTISSHPYSLRS